MDETKLRLSGKVYKIFDSVKISEKFTKREFVIETEDKYPQKVKLEALKDNAVKVNNMLNVGSILDLKFDVKGNEYNGKYYNNLVMYKWEDVTEDFEVNIPEQTSIDVQANNIDSENEVEEELPF